QHVPTDRPSYRPDRWTTVSMDTVSVLAKKKQDAQAVSWAVGNPFFFSDTSNHRPLIQEDPVDGDDVMQCKANYHITYRPQNDAMQCITSV
ncbi:unnamed protein product, partial [Fusarium graminearum]